METLLILIGILIPFTLVNGSESVINVLLGEPIHIKCPVENIEEGGTSMFAVSGKVKSYNEQSWDERIIISKEVKDNITTFIHIINEATFEDETVYSCQIPQRSIENKLNVIVNDPATISVVGGVKEVQAPVGTSIDLQCIAEGKPMPEIKWIREGASLPNGKESMDGESLSLEDIKKDAGGIYVCSADNGFGDEASERISVKALYPPVVTTHFNHSEIRLRLGDQHTFTCSFEGSPDVNVVWKQNDEDINVSDRSNIAYSSEGVSEVQFESSLEINGLTELDFGVYSCIGGNSEGQDDASIEIDGNPYNVKIMSSGYSEWADEFTVIWTMESPLPPIEYTLEFYEYPSMGSGDAEDKDRENQSPTKIFEITVDASDFEEPYQEEYFFNKNLTAEGEYLVILQGSNKLGVSERQQFPFRTSDVYRPTTTEKITTIVPSTEALTTEPPQEITTLVLTTIPKEITTMAPVIEITTLALRTTPLEVETMTSLTVEKKAKEPEVSQVPPQIADSEASGYDNAGYSIQTSSFLFLFITIFILSAYY